MRVAIVYDYLYVHGGGENALQFISSLFDNPEIFTLFLDKNHISEELKKLKIHESNFKYLPFRKLFVKLLVPFLNIFYESWDFSNFDLVVAISSYGSKFVVTSTDVFNISYILTPPRFLWNMETSTLWKYGWLKGLFSIMFFYLRILDYFGARRADIVFTNSIETKKRIWKLYRLNSEVVYTRPVNITLGNDGKENDSIIKQLESYNNEYCTYISRLEKYKHPEIAIDSALKTGTRIVIIGDGDQLKHLKSKYINETRKGMCIFTGFVSDSVKMQILSESRFLIFPVYEDFGLVMIEAMELGIPVVALRKGGAEEIVQEGKNGIFVDKLTVDGFVDGIRKLERIHFAKEEIIKSVDCFSEKELKKEFLTRIASAMNSTKI